MVQVTAGTLGSSVTVSVNAQVGTAENTDFTSTITAVPFAAGETGPKTVNFITVDDDIVEASELFTVSLSSTSGILLGSQA
ncbi:glycosyl hydrolase family, partial [Paramuricea clavata]